MAPIQTRVRLRTRTPLWTGGMRQNMSRVLETGILGSLRWWYEAIVRGLGGWACDPTKHTCSSESGLCDACRMFGSTGWRRRFRLVVSETKEAAPLSVPPRIRASVHPQSAWYLPGAGYMGEFKIELIPWDSQAPLDQILLTLRLITRYSALGAKTGLGYGWVDLVQAPEIDVNTILKQWEEKYFQKGNVAHQQIEQKALLKRLPALTNMFFAQLRVNHSKPYNWQPVADLRYNLRQAFHNQCPGLQSFIMGEVRGQQRRASKIRMTAAVDGQMRVWGWIPEEVERYCNLSQKKVFKTIHNTLQRHGQIQSWQSFTPVDEAHPTHTIDMVSFLSSLLA